MKRFIILGAMAGTALLAGCGATSINNQPAAGSPSGNAVSTPTPANVAHVGATIVLGGNTAGEKLSVQLVKVVDPATADPSTYSSPDAGTHYVAVQFRLTDTGTVAFSDTPSNGAAVVDTVGQIFKSTFGDTTAGPSFPGSVNVIQGGSALGFITFQVPNTSTVAKVQYTTDSGFGQTGEWLVP